MSFSNEKSGCDQAEGSSIGNQKHQQRKPALPRFSPERVAVSLADLSGWGLERLGGGRQKIRFAAGSAMLARCWLGEKEFGACVPLAMPSQGSRG